MIPPAFHVVSGDDDALPRFTVGRVFTEWELVSWATLLILVTTGLYLWGALRLRSRGDHWPIGRTLSFVVVGMGSATLATVSGLAAYDDTLLSAHMVQHMILAMVVPLAMALGAPVTLALRTLPGAPRRWLLVVLHSRVAKVLTFPPLTFTLFVLTPWALYFSGWYPATLHSDYLHELTHFHMVLIGCLFFWPLVGIDPIPGRISYPARMLLIVLTLPFHAFMGVTIMAQKRLIGGSWYPEPARGTDGRLAAHGPCGPAARRRDPVERRRCRRPAVRRGSVRPVGPLVDARGGARGPAPRPPRGAGGADRTARCRRAGRRTGRGPSGGARGCHDTSRGLPVASCP